MRALVQVFLILCYFFSGCLSAQNYTTETISATALSQSFSKIGRLDFKRTANLSFKSSGYLKYLNVDEGDYFSADQILAALDTEELSANKNAKYAQLVNAKRNVKRVKQLIERNLGTEQDLDDANTAVDIARSEYKVAYYNLEKAQIMVPYSGVVIKRTSDLNELQVAGQPILQVASIENNWIVRVALTSDEIQYVRREQPVRVIIKGVGQINAVVSKIPAKANVQSNLFDVEVTLSAVDKNIRFISGQVAQVKFERSQGELVFKVPIASLMSVNKDGKAVFLTASDNSELKPQAFDVIQVDNQFVYVPANYSSDDLHIISQGWQHYVKE